MGIEFPLWLYQAQVVRVIDGDSVVFDIDCGFDIILKNQNTRLDGVDTSETRGGTPELKKLGILAKEFVVSILPVGQDVVLRTKLDDKRGKFGRILADVYLSEGSGVSINTMLLDSHLAVRYQGQSKEEIMQQHLANVEVYKQQGKI